MELLLTPAASMKPSLPRPLELPLPLLPLLLLLNQLNMDDLGLLLSLEVTEGSSLELLEAMVELFIIWLDSTIDGSIRPLTDDAEMMLLLVVAVVLSIPIEVLPVVGIEVFVLKLDG